MAEGAFEVLKLLEKEAPAAAFEDLVRRERAAGASASDLADLSGSVELGLKVRGLFARRQQREAGLAALVDTARDLTLPYELDSLLKVITRRARLLLGLDMSWVTLADLQSGCRRVRAADGHASALTLGFAVPLDGGVGRQAADGCAPFWTADYVNDESFNHNQVIDEVVRAEGLHAIMAVPLHCEGSTLGILYVADRNVRYFTPDEVSLMSSLADLAAVAIEKARLLEQTRDQLTQLEHGTSRTLNPSTSAWQLRETHGRLLALVLDGGGLSSLVADAAQQLDGTLLVRDAVGRTLTVHPAGQVPELDETELHTLLLDTHAGRHPLPMNDHVWAATVAAGEEVLGALVLVSETPVSDHQAELLALTAQIAAVVLLLQQRMTVTESHRRDQFFNDLLRGVCLPAERIVEHGRSFAVELDKPHVIVVARPEQGVQGRVMAWGSSYAHRHRGLKSVDGDVVTLLLPGSDPGALARRVATELREVLGSPVTAGSAGPTTDPASIAEVHQEARRCLDAVSTLLGPGLTASPQELGFLGLLLADRPDVAGFVRDTVGPVLDYDEQQNTVLVPTLEAYFDSAGSPSRAAETLHVHANTVSRRLERITELLGGEWQKPSQVLQVQLALKLNRTRRVLSREHHPRA